MEFVAIVRMLWRFRVLVALAGVFALMTGFATLYRLGLPPSSREYQIGMGTASALVDTPTSQTVDLGGSTGANITTLASRANLLASVMTSSPIKDEIAHRIGVAPDKLLAGDAAVGPPGAAPPGRDAITLAATVPAVESGELPIIAVKTQAPDRQLAERLANAAFEQLQSQLASVAGIDKVPDSRRLVVRRLGAATSQTIRRGPSTILGVAVFLVTLLVGCGLIVGTSAFVESWRRVSALEEYAAESDEVPLWLEDTDIGTVESHIPVAPARGPHGTRPEGEPPGEAGTLHSLEARQ
jgi:hypothetical protein